jgi:hypothetical protein
MSDEIVQELIERIEKLSRPGPEPIRLNTTDAARYLGFPSKRPLERLRTLGGGPKFQRGGLTVFYLVADLRDWAEAQHSFSNANQAELYLSNKTG